MVFEDDWVVVLDKPAGQNSQPTPMGDFGSVITVCRERFDEGVRLVHRLDRDVSGLMVVARTPESAGRLSRQIRAHTVQRVYRAVVSVPLPDGTSGTIDKPLKWAGGRCWVDPAGARAVTHWRVVGPHPAGTSLEVRLETGRMHQIRVHLQAAIGPIAGDTKYGGSPAAHLHLRAVSLSFRHPGTGRPVTFDVPAAPP